MCTASIDGVKCAVERPHIQHARGFLMWDESGWCSCRQYDDHGDYIFPGDPRWNGDEGL